MFFSKITYISASYYLIFLGVNLLIASIGYLINVPIVNIAFLLSFVITLVIIIVFISKNKLNKKEAIWAFILCTVIFLVLLLLSGKFYDTSYDGQVYQQEGIIQLYENWNPVYDEPLTNEVYGYTWINHYAKGTWINGSSLFRLTGNIEYSKVFNLILIISSAFLTFTVLHKLNLKNSLNIVISLLAAFNPVSINQAFSFYIDGQLASLLLCFIMILYLVAKEVSMFNSIILSSCIIITVNIKFTALVYTIIFCIGLIVYFYMKKRSKLTPIVLTLIVSLFIGVIIVGFNPYVTNTFSKGHPFYPLYGNDSIDIMSHNTNAGLIGKNSFEKLTLSLFSYSTNNTQEVPELKFPLVVKRSELGFFDTDTRIGGFGPLFGSLIVFSLIISGVSIFIIIRKKDKNSGLLLYLVMIILISVIINPESWWARYVPQLWVFPILVLILSEITFKKNFLTKTSNIVFVMLLLVNLALATGPKLLRDYTYSRAIADQMSLLKSNAENSTLDIDFDIFESNRVRFKSENVKFNQSKLKCTNHIELIGTYGQGKVCINEDKKINNTY